MSTEGGVSMSCPSKGSPTPGYKSETCCTWWICIDTDDCNTEAYGVTCFRTWNGPKRFKLNFRAGRIVHISRASSHTLDPTSIFGAGIRPWFAPSSWTAWLRLISTLKCSSICCIEASTWSASRRRWTHFCVAFPANDIDGTVPWTAKNGVHFVDSDTP